LYNKFSRDLEIYPIENAIINQFKMLKGKAQYKMVPVREQPLVYSQNKEHVFVTFIYIMLAN